MTSRKNRYLRFRRVEIAASVSIAILTCVILLFNKITLPTVYGMSAILFLTIYGIAALVFLIFNYRKLVVTTFACTGAIALFLKLNFDANQHFAFANNTEELVVQLVNLDLVSGSQEEQSTLFSGLDGDVVIFQGYTPKWRKLINEHVSKQLLYRWRFERIDIYGQYIVSRKAFRLTDTLQYEGIPVLRYDVRLNSKDRIRLISLILPPGLTDGVENQTMKLINRLMDAKNENDTSIILGNFNLTPWSDRLQALMYKTDTKNSRINKSKLNLFQENPFDYYPTLHLLYSKEIQNIHFTELEFNSKHIGISGSYQIKQ